MTKRKRIANSLGVELYRSLADCYHRRQNRPDGNCYLERDNSRTA